MVTNEANNTTQFPSTNLSFEFVKPSYDVMEKRFEATNSRIQNLLTWSIGITTAIPIFAKAVLGETNMNSVWILPVLLFFIALVFVGILAYKTGGVKLIHPTIIYEDYIQQSEQEFKKLLVYWAGQHFEANRKTIDQKNRYIDIMTIFLGLEMAFAVLWVFLT
jgi:hypothetical protein